MSVKYILSFSLLSFVVSFFLGNVISTPDFIAQIIYGIYIVVICAVIFFVMKQLEFVKNIELKKVKYLSLAVILVVVIGFHLIISWL